MADATLVALGATSLQAIALQYQILERTGAELTLESLLGDAPSRSSPALLGEAPLGAARPEEAVGA